MYKIARHMSNHIEEVLDVAVWIVLVLHNNMQQNELPEKKTRFK